MRADVLLLNVLVVALGVGCARAHCQVPCGIYAHEERVEAMLEDVDTISKAVREMTALTETVRAGGAGVAAFHFNQLVRWTNTKDDHANKIMDVVSSYFLTQVVKEVDADADGYDAYLVSLADHHKVLRLAMKAKQTVDAAVVAQLRAAVQHMGALYGWHTHAHDAGEDDVHHVHVGLEGVADIHAAVEAH